MGRLTKYGKTSHENGVCCTHFMSKECKEVGGECSYGCRWEEEAWSKLAHYEDLEEQLMKSAEIDIDSMVGEFMHYYNLQKENRLIELPCAVGDTVYFYQVFRSEADPVKIFEGIITSVEWNSENIGLWVNVGDYAENIFAGILGKHVFLTKEAAEAKLKELEGMK